MRARTAIIAATIGALAAAGAFGTGDSEAEAGTTTITMWDYQNVEAWTNAYNEIVAKYQETHPDVQVERRALSHEGGEELVKAAALAGNLPDLVPFEPGEPFNTAVEQGIIEDMEPDITADPEWFSWVERYLADPGMRYNGKGIYRIAADVYHIVSFFYRDLAPAPRTVPELVAACPGTTGTGHPAGWKRIYRRLRAGEQLRCLRQPASRGRRAGLGHVRQGRPRRDLMAE